MVVCLAAIHSLPSEVLEAAELDNCGWAGKLRFVIIPLLRPTLLNLYILAFVGKMKVSAMLEALPGVGKVRAQKVMEELNISTSRRLRGLGDKQKQALKERFGRR